MFPPSTFGGILVDRSTLYPHPDNRDERTD